MFKIINVFFVFNPKQGWGGRLAPPVVFCHSTLIFDNITVKFCDF